MTAAYNGALGGAPRASGAAGRAGALRLEKGCAARGLDWPGLMRAGMRNLGLKPVEFWDLSPGELALMLGVQFGRGTMTRARLNDLMAAFPDPGRGATGAVRQGECDGGK